MSSAYLSAKIAIFKTNSSLIDESAQSSEYESNSSTILFEDY